MKKPVVGQTLYSRNVGNAARGGRESVLTEVVVKKVGRKYFTCGTEGETWRDTVYHLSDWREKTEYCVNFSLYTSRQEREDEKEAMAIFDEVSDVFRRRHNHRGISLDALRGIKRILDKAKDKEGRG